MPLRTVAFSLFALWPVAFVVASVPSHRVSVKVIPMLSSTRQSSATIVPLKASRPEESTEWRQLGGVALSILADLDRRRLKLVASPLPEQKSKAA